MHECVTPLHVRSGYSLLRGPARPERLCERARALGHDALALTDVNGLYGAPVFCRSAAAAGLRPIIGAELREAGRAVVALVADDVGYEDLCRVITRIHRRVEARRPGRAGARGRERSADGLIADLAELGEGLELIVSDAGVAGELVRAGRRPWLGVDPPTQGHSQRRRLSECGSALSLPAVATGKAVLVDPEDRDTARLLAAIGLGTTYDNVEAGRVPHAGAVLRGPAAAGGNLAGFPGAAANNRRLVERCAGRGTFPRRTVFPDVATPGGIGPGAWLRRLCRDGLRRRYGRIAHTARDRLEKELRLINRRKLAGYFLVVRDIVRYARRRGAPVAGRGSGASSLVAYALGITNVCPLTYDLPFERFLNERREDYPDLDVDFCWRIRDDVIDYALRRWGEGRAAMVCMHSTFRAASSLRETAKAFGLSNAQITRFVADPSAGPRVPGVSEAVSGRILRLSARLSGLPFALSVHPGGVVLGRKPVDHYAPLQRAAKGVTITQYDKDGVADAGLVKLDLLGNRNLSTVRRARELVRRRRGRAIDVEALPPSDPATVRALRSADTVGCNQLESPAMRHLLRMLAPAGVGDVMKALALIRPGAASIGMKEVFVRRHRGLDRASDGPLAGVLRDTYGVMLYEDDVMLTASALLGISPAEADVFRRAVQKCRDDRQRLRLSEEFLARCSARGIDADYAADIWVQMAKFNAYSFCRAHAASYAVLAYAGAYLKTHYPLEFWASALNNNQSMYHPRVYVEEAKRDGVRFLLPDANRSEAEFAVEGEAIRVGLGCVEHLGPSGAASMVAARRGGAYGSPAEAVARAGLGADAARSLVLCGAFDFTGRTRPALMAELALAGRARGPRGTGRPLLAAAPEAPAGLGDYPPRRKRADERRVLGVTVGEHLLTGWRPRLAGRVDADSRSLADRVGRRIRIAGLLEARRTTGTADGRTMTFLTFQDEHGLFEVTVFPPGKTSQGCFPAGALPRLDRYGPYVVTGRVEDQYGSPAVAAGRVAPFDGARGSPERARAAPASAENP